MKYLFFLFTIGYLFFIAAPAAAQQTALSLTPPVIEILLSPNKKIVQAFQLTNQGESGNFVATLHTVTPTDNEGHSTLDPHPLNLTTIPLVVQLSNADRQLDEPFFVAGGKTTQLVLTIEGASTDLTQDIYFALTVSPVPATLNNSTATIPGISALILVTLTPDGILPVQLKIENFTLPVLHDNLTPLTFNPILTNSSAVMLRPEGNLHILSPRGKHTKDLKLYPNLVLAHSSRLVKQQLVPLPSSSAPRAAPLTWQPNLTNLGPYRFQLNIITAGGQELVSTEKVVWLLPIRALIIIILLALIVIPLLISIKKRYSASSPP